VNAPGELQQTRDELLPNFMANPEQFAVAQKVVIDAAG
jgi:hypothetical protein